MRRIHNAEIERRDFLAGVLPACVGCMGICAPTSLASMTETLSASQEPHMFDQEWPRLTVRQYFSRVLSSGGELLKAIRNEIGEGEIIRILRDYSFNRGKSRGASLVEQYPDRDFHSHNERFRSGDMEGIIIYTIVEDTDEAFEISVTECALVEPLMELDIGRIGNAWLCHGDYGHAEGFNPRIKLIRDKTLMLGDSCCNHRYVWT